jgi:hypothetical protein
MRITPSEFRPNVFTVHVDAGELQCDVRPLPYPTCIGCIDVTKKRVALWSPAASKPRGYKPAALAMLTVALASKLAEVK